MQKVIVIRHSDEDNQNSKYVANLQKNKDGRCCWKEGTYRLG